MTMRHVSHLSNLSSHITHLEWVLLRRADTLLKFTRASSLGIYRIGRRRLAVELTGWGAELGASLAGTSVGISLV